MNTALDAGLCRGFFLHANVRVVVGIFIFLIHGSLMILETHKYLIRIVSLHSLYDVMFLIIYQRNFLTNKTRPVSISVDSGTN